MPEARLQTANLLLLSQLSLDHCRHRCTAAGTMRCTRGCGLSRPNTRGVRRVHRTHFPAVFVLIRLCLFHQEGLADPSLVCPNRCSIRRNLRQPPSSHRKRVISTSWPSAAVFAEDQFKPFPRSSCLIHDAASRLAAIHPPTPRPAWLFPAPAGQLAECPSSHSNRLDSIFRRSEAIRVAVGWRCSVMTRDPPSQHTSASSRP